MTTETAKAKASGDWPTLLKDNARTGGQGQHPARSPERAVWQFRAGSSVRSAPILAGGMLYVASVNGVVHAIDVASGTIKMEISGGEAGSFHAFAFRKPNSVRMR